MWVVLQVSVDVSEDERILIKIIQIQDITIDLYNHINFIITNPERFLNLNYWKCFYIEKFDKFEIIPEARIEYLKQFLEFEEKYNSCEYANILNLCRIDMWQIKFNQYLHTIKSEIDSELFTIYNELIFFYLDLHPDCAEILYNNFKDWYNFKKLKPKIPLDLINITSQYIENYDCITVDSNMEICSLLNNTEEQFYVFFNSMFTHFDNTTIFKCKSISFADIVNIKGLNEVRRYMIKYNLQCCYFIF